MSLDLDRPITLWRHAALKTRRDGDVLVLPERAIRLGGSSSEILRLCGDGRTGQEIVSAMRSRYPETDGIDTEVITFLEEMLALGGLVGAEHDVGESPR